MQNHAQFLPLRKDASRQAELVKLSRSTATAWSSRPEVDQVLQDLERYGEGESIGRCPALERIVTDHAAAREFVARFSATVAAMLEDNPFCEPDFGHHSTSGVSTIQFGKSGRAEFSVTCFDARSDDAQEIRSMRFFDCERHEIIVTGTAEAVSARYLPAAPPDRRIESMVHCVEPGTTLRSYRADALTARTYTKIAQRLIVLRLVRQPDAPMPTREVSLSDGALLGQACGDKRSSTREVMLVALGRMGRKDAVPAMAGIARSGSEQLRWEAIRQCLALDVAQGFALLCEAARAPDDSLHGPASALRAQLIEAHPQLAQLEHEPCPA